MTLFTPLAPKSETTNRTNHLGTPPEKDVGESAPKHRNYDPSGTSKSSSRLSGAQI